MKIFDEAKEILGHILILAKSHNYEFEDYEAFSFFLQTVVDIYIQLGNKDEAINFLRQILVYANDNNANEYHRLCILELITKACKLISLQESCKKFLQEVVSSAKNVKVYHLEALTVKAQANAQLDMSKEASNDLLNALKLANDSNNPRNLLTTMQVYVELGLEDNQILDKTLLYAKNFKDRYNIPETLQLIANTCRQLSNQQKAKELLYEIISLGISIGFPCFIDILREVIDAYVELDEEQLDINTFLKEILLYANIIHNDACYCSNVLELIAEASIQLRNSKKAKELLYEILILNKRLRIGDGEPDFRPSVLQKVAEAYIVLMNQKLENDDTFLQKILAFANYIKYENYRAEALELLIDTYIQLNDLEKVQTFFDNIFSYAHNMIAEEDRNKVLVSLAKAYIKLDDIENAFKIINSFCFQNLNKIIEFILKEKLEIDDNLIANIILSSLKRGDNQHKFIILKLLPHITAESSEKILELLEKQLNLDFSSSNNLNHPFFISPNLMNENLNNQNIVLDKLDDQKTFTIPVTE